MLRISIVATALIALAAPAQAARCNQPYAPTIKLAPNATTQDLERLRGDTVAFIAASDVYQKCLLATGGADRISANQALKKKIGAQFNETVRAFRAAHPGV